MNELVSHNSYYKILIIEDNPGDARLVEIYLQASDLFLFEIVHKMTLAEGLEALEDGDFAAILLDINLPDSRGFITLENLLSKFPEENVILLTGTKDKNLGIRAIKAGAQDYLVKGDYDTDLLAKTLKYSIERNRIIKRLEEAQRITHIGHWDYDLTTKMFEVSDEVFRIFGSKTNTFQNPSPEYFLSHVHPDDQHLLEEMYSELNTNKEVGRDLRIILKDDSVRYISVLYRANKRDSSQVTRLSGVVQDITERKLAEQEIIKRKKRYEVIYDQSKDAIYISTIDGKFVDFNRATIDLFGYSVEELMESGSKPLYKDQKKRDEFQNEVRNSSFVRDFEIDIVRKDGTVRNCLVTASTITTEEFRGYQGIIRDITEHRQAEMLREEKEIAERSAKLKEQFLANVSHEMRTPMNAVIGMSHLLLKTELDEEQFNYVNSIRQSSENLLGIINDILDIAKSQNEDIVFEKAEFDIFDLVANLANVLQVQTDAKKLGLEISIEETVPNKVLGDHLRLNQILINLTGNAVKFTDMGMVCLDISLVEESKDDLCLRFSVRDTGIGMSDEQLQVIFDPFTRVASNKERLYEGTGLGLSIIKRLVELQGGRINVKSELGVGSTFSFDLSFEKSKGQTDVEMDIEEKDLSLPEGLEVSILVVEDNRINQTVAKNTIIKQWPSVKVEVADNGRMAIEKFTENHYDIILMDIQMPIMDGEEATHYIRTHFEDPKRNTPIIAMTAHVFVKSDKKYLEYGMDGCVLKPFQPVELFEVILSFLEEQSQRKDKNPEDEKKEPSDYSLIDLTYLEMMTDGDLNIKSVLLGMLLHEPVEEIEKMKEYALAENWAELKQVSHKLKTTFPYIGFTELIETNKKIDHLLWKVEEEVDNLDTIKQEVPGLVTMVEQLYQKALVELKMEFATLKTPA